MSQRLPVGKAAPRGAALSSSPRHHVGALRGTWLPYEKRLMAVQRQQAAYRVEIERAIDAIKRTRSNTWFRALLHQGVLRNLGPDRGPRITDDDGNVVRRRHGERPVKADASSEPRGVLSEARRQ